MEFRSRSVPHLAGHLLLAMALGAPCGSAAQGSGDSEGNAAVLEREFPGMFEALTRLERAHGVLFGQLWLEGEAVRATGEDLPTFGFEFDMVERLTFLLQADGTADEVAEEAAAGFAVLGSRGAEIIARGNAFYREVLVILADERVTDRRAELAEAVQRYRSKPAVALSPLPKDMDVLYDHQHAQAFRGGYADLGGVIWAGHWMKLAATEPLTDFPGRAERLAGLDTVTNRFYSKLSYGQPPEFFPTELPMAPAIAPGIIFLSSESAVIWDNLAMMQEVLADVIAAPGLQDVRGAVDAVIDHFMDPTYGVTDVGDWESMALGHGIFYQGGYPLGDMTTSELNGGGHAAHLAALGRRPAPILIRGMPE